MDEAWDTEIGPRYRHDKTITVAALAAELRVHESTLIQQMRNRGSHRNVSRKRAVTDLMLAKRGEGRG